MNIGIYGGSFNPIHRGHTALAKSLVRQGLVDEVWLMVSPLNPLKAGDTYEGRQPTYEQRLRMVQLATQDIHGVTPSDFEQSLPLPSYTITTLRELSSKYPEHKFTLIIGADNWERFPRWYKHDEILRDYHIIVFRRPDCDFSSTDIPQGVTLAHTPLYNISSTQIRDLIRTSTPTPGLINKKVLLYIQKHHLYH